MDRESGKFCFRVIPNFEKNIKPNNSSEKKWCVIIPTFNNDKTLEKVLKEVLNICKNIIVVNYPGKNYLKVKKFNKIKLNFWTEIVKIKPKKETV